MSTIALIIGYAIIAGLAAEALTIFWRLTKNTFNRYLKG